MKGHKFEIIIIIFLFLWRQLNEKTKKKERREVIFFSKLLVNILSTLKIIFAIFECKYCNTNVISSLISRTFIRRNTVNVSHYYQYQTSWFTFAF